MPTRVGVGVVLSWVDFVEMCSSVRRGGGGADGRWGRLRRPGALSQQFLVEPTIEQMSGDKGKNSARDKAILYLGRRKRPHPALHHPRSYANGHHH
jgi:hypothetical protein